MHAAEGVRPAVCAGEDRLQRAKRLSAGSISGLSCTMPAGSTTYSPPNNANFSSFDTRRYYGLRTTTKAVAWNADGSRLICSGDVSNAIGFDTSRVAESGGAGKGVNQNFFSTATPSSVVSGGVQGKIVYECRSQSKDMSSLLPSPTSASLFAITGFDKVVNIFDVRVGSRPIQSCALPSACLYADWAPDGTTIGVGLATDSIAFLDCLSWKLRYDKDKDKDNGKLFEGDLSLNQFRWTADGKKILLGRSSGYAHLLQWPSLSLITTLRGHVASCSTVACDPKAKYFAIASVDTTVSVWDAETVTNVYTVDRRDVPLVYLAFSSDGSILAIAGQFDGIDLIDSHTGSLLHVIHTTSRVSCLSWHPSKNLLAYTLAKASSRDRHTSSTPSGTLLDSLSNPLGGPTGPPVFVWGFK